MIEKETNTKPHLNQKVLNKRKAAEGSFGPAKAIFEQKDIQFFLKFVERHGLRQEAHDLLVARMEINH